MATALIVAPHPDDEMLGAGGTLLRHLAQGDNVHVVICTRGREEMFGKEQVERVQGEARLAHMHAGVTKSHFLDLPAAELDTMPGLNVNAALAKVYREVQPDVVYAPHVGDVHRDHQIIFQAVMVCSRPVGNGGYPARVLAYETVSETDWYAPPLTPTFIPNVFVDISPYIDRKLELCAVYQSQMRKYPDQRSPEALRALAVTRGTSMNMRYAEAFMLIRELQPLP